MSKLPYQPIVEKLPKNARVELVLADNLSASLRDKIEAYPDTYILDGAEWKKYISSMIAGDFLMETQSSASTHQKDIQKPPSYRLEVTSPRPNFYFTRCVKIIQIAKMPQLFISNRHQTLRRDFYSGKGSGLSFFIKCITRTALSFPTTYFIKHFAQRVTVWLLLIISALVLYTLFYLIGRQGFLLLISTARMIIKRQWAIISVALANPYLRYIIASSTLIVLIRLTISIRQKTKIKFTE